MRNPREIVLNYLSFPRLCILELGSQVHLPVNVLSFINSGYGIKHFFWSILGRYLTDQVIFNGVWNYPFGPNHILLVLFLAAYSLGSDTFYFMNFARSFSSRMSAMLEILHTHLLFLFPKFFPMFICHYLVSYILGRIFL
jgi:hypothetical protein